MANQNSVATGSVEGRLIRLVYFDHTSGKLKTDPDAILALMELQGPVAVVSVCGPAHRTAKTSVFNELVGRNTRHYVASKDHEGIWMWSAPMKRTAVDGSQYNVIFLDGEGLDACDQTVTFNMKIFSLAVHLSSTVVYNLMGGIDETSDDDRSFAAETSKYIRNKVYGAEDTISELGQLSPVFVWLLKDLQSDSSVDTRKITSSDDLGQRRRPVLGVQKDVATSNDITESFRGIFSDRECFALVRLLKDDSGLQYLGCAMLEKFQSEHRSELSALTKFACERAVPKQVGGTVITGSILASIAECYVDALNNGADCTVASLWQDVEESECRKAFNTAMKVYSSVFIQAKPLQEVPVEQAHNTAVQSSIVAFHAGAIGPGSARRKYEVLLEDFFKKSYQEAQNNAATGAGLHCSSAIDKMKNKLEAACQGANVKFDDIAMVLDGLLLEYEVVVSPARCHQLSLTKSMLGPIFDYFKKVIHNVSSDKDDLLLRCCAVEEKAGLLQKNLEASEKLKSEYQIHYEDAVKDMNNLSHHYKNRMIEMESNCRSIEDKCSSLLEMLDGVKQESLDWKLKYEESLTKMKDFDDLNDLKENVIDPQPSDVLSKFPTAGKQAWRPEPKHSANEAQMAFEEARQWKDKYDLAVNEAKDAMEKAETELKLLADQAKLREEALRVEFSNSLAKKDEEIKDTMMKLEDAERRLNTLTSDFQDGEKRIQTYDLEASNLKLQFRELNDKYEFIKASNQSLENEAQMRLQEKEELEQKYLSESKRLEEIQARCKVAEEEVNVAQARLKEKAEVEQKYLADLKVLRETHERCKSWTNESATARLEMPPSPSASFELGQYLIESDLTGKPVTLLEEMLKERNQEIEQWKSKCEQLSSSVQVVDDAVFESEHELATSFDPDSLEAKLHSIEQHLNSENANEDDEMPSEMKFSTPLKRTWSPESFASPGQSMASDGGIRTEQQMKRQKTDMSLQKCRSTEVGNESALKADSEAEDDAESRKPADSVVSYSKLTVARMRQELNEGGFGAELLKLKSRQKKDVYALYKKHVLKN